MRRLSFVRWVAMLAGWLFVECSLSANPTNTAPEFKEIYDLLRVNLPGATDESLNQAAVKGLLVQFRGQVSLIDGRAGNSGDNGVLTKSTLLEGNIAYCGVSRVEAGLAEKMSKAYRALVATNKIIGLVLDLRFAGGDDDSAAMAAAKLFAPAKTISGPLAVLVNGETRGAAVTLAATLRKAEAGLVLGSPPAGGATAFKEFQLRNGERLRITLPQTNTDTGSASPRLQPDIVVAVDPDEERAFRENPYATPKGFGPGASAGGRLLSTNSFLPFVDHTSEADLVREKIKDGAEIEGSTRVPTTEPAKPVIRDPVLARAVDLIKGLAVVRQLHH